MFLIILEKFIQILWSINYLLEVNMKFENAEN